MEKEARSDPDEIDFWLLRLMKHEMQHDLLHLSATLALMSKKIVKDDEHRELLRRAQRSLESLSSQAHLLEFVMVSQGSKGKDENIGEILLSSIQLLNPLARWIGTEIIFSGTATAKYDFLQMRRLFVGLLANSLRSIESTRDKNKGPIEVHISSNELLVTVDIKNGCFDFRNVIDPVLSSIEGLRSTQLSSEGELLTGWTVLRELKETFRASFSRSAEGDEYNFFRIHLPI